MDDRTDQGESSAEGDSDGQTDRIPIDSSFGDEEPAASAANTPRNATATSSPHDPDAIRRWTGLSAVLGIVSLLVALAVGWQGSPGEAIGAGALGLAFLAIGVFGSRRAPTLPQSLADGWAEHRRYVGGAAGLFFLGVAGGLALGAAGVDLLELITEVTGQDPFAGIEEADLTAWWFVRNNTLPFLVAIAGAVTLGLLSAYILAFNGLLVGNVAWVTGDLVGADYILVGLLPHGVFELTALFVAAGVGFRLVHRFAQRVAGSRDAIVTRSYVRRTVSLVVFAWLVLVLAAFVETYVTSPLLEALFAARLEQAAPG